jgi:hypothetical protein
MYPFLCLHPNQQISNAVLPSTKKTILYRWRSAPKETLFSGIALITKEVRFVRNFYYMKMASSNRFWPENFQSWRKSSDLTGKITVGPIN